MPSRSRSRKKSSAAKPALIAIILLAIVVAGWFWQRQRSEAPPAAESPAVSTTSEPGLHSEPLPLPPPDSAGPAIAPATPATAPTATAANGADALPAFLPPEARQTLRLIAQGGPFPHREDGSVFGNREGRLPRQPQGYYREYTVDTPGLSHRGARRIVTGGQPPREYYYTDDHYESFRRFERGNTEIGNPGVQR
ncbi:ribonuclease domain-containing protein [Pseudoxanthomonas sp. UTMC 1351]|uniref:ribonuclease domain-containing protein n=1 Tax=Pseudoxanthomonas sp. UTMC 1351 TaxID=2695853 RepID=UPI0034CD1C3B